MPSPIDDDLIEVVLLQTSSAEDEICLANQKGQPCRWRLALMQGCQFSAAIDLIHDDPRGESSSMLVPFSRELFIFHMFADLN